MSEGRREWTLSIPLLLVFGWYKYVREGREINEASGRDGRKGKE